MDQKISWVAATESAELKSEEDLGLKVSYGTVYRTTRTSGTTLLPESTANQWDRAIYAFLAEKQRRSGSDCTVQGYSGMLRHFFGSLGKTPNLVSSQKVFVWAHGKSTVVHDHQRSHRVPQSSYRFLI